MLERKDVMPVAFLKKERFTGSLKGMRYRMEMAKEGEEARLKVTIWPEPYSFDATKEEDKRWEFFPRRESAGECSGSMNSMRPAGSSGSPAAGVWDEVF